MRRNDVDPNELQPLFTQVSQAPQGLQDGIYEVVIVDAVLARNGVGDPGIRWTLKVLAGAHKDSKLGSFNRLTTPENMRYVDNDLRMFGASLEGGPTKLPEILKGLIGRRAMVTRRTRRGHVNVFFERAIAQK